jgi:DNA polymerase-1
VRSPRPTCVDFETFAIEPRPEYPPVPTSVSIKPFGKRARFYSWGHLSGNNCMWGEAREALVAAYANPHGVLMHNAKFDLAVAERHFGLKPPLWDRVHDTLFLLFLDDPNQTELGLKPASKRVLGWEPEERDAVADWLVENQPVPGVKISKSTSSQAKAPFGAYIWAAPGHVVGPYADGDTGRTEALFRHLWPSVVVERGMGGAYDRERRLLPVLMEMEEQGVRVDLPRLRADVATYRSWLGKVDAYLLGALGVGDVEFNLNAGAQVVRALIDAGMLDEAQVPRTEPSKTFPTGQLKSDEETFSLVTDRAVGAALTYRAKLKTCLVTFMENWLSVAERSGGLIFTEWHQTRGSDGGGARTGRLSSSPNFQNLSKLFDAIWHHEAKKIKDPAERKKFLATAPRLPGELRGLPALPLVRSYVVPWAPGDVLVDRDYSQQEPRILAHLEGGTLMRQYQANPWIDYHDNAREHLERIMGRHYERKPVKNINLGIIYGQGVGSLAKRNGSSVEETKSIRDAIYRLYPGLRDMNRAMSAKAERGEPLVTWGGRKCLCEPPKVVKGKFMTFDYKMINTCVQGSAGDCTKEAMVRLHGLKYLDQYALACVKVGAFEEELRGARRSEWRLYFTVHDELLMSVPVEDLPVAMEAMRLAMESVEFDVQMLSEGDYGDDWASLKKYDKRGVQVHGTLRDA